MRCPRCEAWSLYAVVRCGRCGWEDPDTPDKLKWEPAEPSLTIRGLDGLAIDGISLELERGARFVTFDYCISAIFMTFRESSHVYFVRAGESAVAMGLRFTAVSLLLGWWGIPWGPVYTISSVARNFRGGRDVTAEIVSSLSPQ